MIIPFVINGRVKVVDRAELKDVQLEVFNADEKAEVLQGLLIDVDESYSHCPRALKFSKLWDTELIAKNIVAPPCRRKNRESSVIASAATGMSQGLG